MSGTYYRYAIEQPRENRGRIVAPAVIAILALCYFLISPLLSVYRLKKAIAEADVDAVQDSVDFPALRASLKDQLNGAILRSAQQEGDKDNGWAALGSVFISAMAGPLLDAYVTPQGLINLVNTPTDRLRAGPNLRRCTRTHTRRWQIEFID